MLCFFALLLKGVTESRNCSLAFAHFDYVMVPFPLCNSLFHDQQGFGYSLIVVGEGCRGLNLEMYWKSNVMILSSFFNSFGNPVLKYVH